MRSSPNPLGSPASSGERPGAPSDSHNESSNHLLAPHAAAAPPPSRADSSSPRIASFDEMITGGNGSKVLGTASTGLEELKIILEAVDTLPFVKALASVGIQVLQYVIVG